MRLLDKFFTLDPEWSKDTIKFISSFLSLTELQLYKWGYDQKRKFSCKKGIRNKVRENRRRKYSDNCITDYNSMVSELFPEEDETIDTKKSFLVDQFEQLKASYLNSKDISPKRESRIINISEVEKPAEKIEFADISMVHDNSPFQQTAQDDYFNGILEYESFFRECKSSGLADCMFSYVD